MNTYEKQEAHIEYLKSQLQAIMVLDDSSLEDRSVKSAKIAQEALSKEMAWCDGRSAFVAVERYGVK